MRRGKRVSWTRVDLPLPETPVTQVKRPTGKATSILRRLFPRAPFRTSQPSDTWTRVYQNRPEIQYPSPHAYSRSHEFPRSLKPDRSFGHFGTVEEDSADFEIRSNSCQPDFD